MGRNERSRVPVPLSTIEQRLVEQLSFLRKSASEFDAGDTSEYQRMAVALRILLHDRPPSSKSLLAQLGLTEVPFASTAYPIDDKNMLSQFSLAIMTLGSGGGALRPRLDIGPFPPRWISFDNWWREPVLRDKNRHDFTRADFISIVANQDGGAHVDTHIDQAYNRLANEHSIGWQVRGPSAEAPLRHIEKVYMRQITWEALVSIEPAWAKVIGKRPCQCGSGRKTRYCCGKATKPS